MMRAGALDLAINGRRQSLALRPFLENGLGIAQRTPRLVHALGPVALDEIGRRRVAALEEDGADHGLADAAEHALAQARVGAGADRPGLEVVEQTGRLGDIGAGLLA